MKKKNTQSEGQNKLHTNIVYEHFKDSFLKIVDKVDVISDNESLESFFNELYYPSIPFRTQHLEKNNYFKDIEPNLIGQSEWELLSFSSNYKNISNNERILFLLGKVGTGKSTLINYIFRYLIKKRSVNKKIIPIIIDCQTKHPQLSSIGKNEKVLMEFVFNNMLKGKLSKLLKPYIELTNEAFWSWYETKSETQYSEQYSDIKNLYFGKTVKNKINILRAEEKKNNDFYFFATKYLKETTGKNIVIIFDNLDPFDISILTNFFWISKTIVNYSPTLRVIMSMRETTYNKIYHTINEIKRIKKWEHTVDFWEILNKRCYNLKKTINLESQNNPLVLKINDTEWTISCENTDKLLAQLINAILNPDGKNYLLEFSKGNIRSQLELLTIVFSSGMIPKSVFGRILISNEDLEKKYVISSSLILRAIVTFGYYTFFTSKSKELNIPGLINVLSCAYNQHQIKMFIKLFILRYLKNKQGANDVNIKKIKSDWNDAVGEIYEDEIVFDSFRYCLFRLFNAGLISSPDIHYVKDIEDFEANISEISISDLGRLYIDDLISNPEYLIFIKDDVYLDDVSTFEGCKEVITKYPLNKQYWINLYNTIIFLKQYGEMELQILKRINSFERITFFIQLFSTPNSPMITLKILEDLKQFIKQKTTDESCLMDVRAVHQLDETISYFKSQLETIKL